MKNIPHILCVDDDDKIRQLLKIYLKKKNFRVSIAKDAFEADEFTKFFTFDLIILDIMMPKQSGIKFLNNFRKFNKNVPVIMLTASSQIKKKTESYNVGCDDYLIKPFEPIELILRMNKLLNPRVNKIKSLRKSYFGEYEFDLSTRELKKNNYNINLTSSEEHLLEILSKNLNKEISREEIAKKLNVESNLRSIDVTVTRLRKKISSNKSSFLKTVRGKGYMLVSEYDQEI